MQLSFNLQGNLPSSFFFDSVNREGEGIYVDYNWRHAFDGKKDCASDCPQVTWAQFSSKFFGKMGTVAFSLLFGK
jgi:hypothetical protein